MARSPLASRPVRVAHVIPGLHYGGMERVLHDLANALPERGFEIHIVVLEALGRFAEGLDKVAQIHQVPAMSKLSLLYPGELLAILRSIEPDIVHSHAGVWFKASRAARLARVPVVIHTEHGRRVPDRVTDRLIDHLASRQTDTVIAVSEALAEVLRRVVHDPSQLRVIINGVDVDRLRPTADVPSARRALDLPADVPVIGSIGRLQPVKNYRLALTAFAELGETLNGGPPPLLVLVGDGIERGMLEELARTLGIGSRVRFLGWRDEVERVYGAFDLFTLTSRSEGTSVSLLEAMSSGLCPVVTDVGGNRAAMGPELASLLVPTEDAAGLAATWRRLLLDDSLRRQFGVRARSRVEQEFSLRRMVDSLVALYRDRLAASGTPHGRVA